MRRWNRAAVLGPIALIALAGCILVDALVQRDRPFAFPHEVHVFEEGLDCSDCHGDPGEYPTFPVAAQCALCHDDLDAEKPPELQVASLFDEGLFRALHAGRHSPEVLFSHEAHAVRAQDCSTCHAFVAEDDGDLAAHADEIFLSMDDCLSCHSDQGGPGPRDCAACHAEIRAELPPPSHVADWTRAHGTFVRAHADGRTDECSLCHAPASCDTCHSVELPMNHTNYWRRRAHGITASMDRDSCSTCHDSDSCMRCHEDTRPMSHVGSWGEPQDRHCVACHEPLRGESCGVCHQGTPSHALATPLPPGHLPGMNCRMCHGNGQPLPHVDNGQLCTSCHF